MKSFLLFVFSTGIFSTTFSQDFKYEAGIESGYSIVSLRGDQFSKKFQAENKVDYTTKISVPVGVSLQCNFKKVLSFRTGIYFENKGNILQLSSTMSETSDIKYLTLPLMLRASYGAKAKVFAELGPSFSYLIKHTVDYNYYTYDTAFAVVFFSPTTTDYTDHLKKMDVGLSMGMGIGFTVKKQFSISLEWRGNMGMSDINNYSASSPGYYREGKIQTGATHFLIGVAYKFGDVPPPYEYQPTI